MSDACVLVVDDSPTTLRVTAEALREAGFSVVTAVDGEDAILKAKEFRPNVVVLDIILPKKNGFQVCREIKSAEFGLETRVLMLTSKAQESDREYGQKQGADGYMTKPFEDDSLVSAVQSLLANGASTQTVGN